MKAFDTKKLFCCFAPLLMNKLKNILFLNCSVVMKSCSLSRECSHFSKMNYFNSALCHNLTLRRWASHNVSLYHDHEKSFYAGKQKPEQTDSKFWKNELLILKKIGNHQNIVRFFSTCLCTTHRFSTIIMELCDGNLEEYVLNSAIIPLSQLSFNKDSPLTMAQNYFACKLLDILHQTTRGLQYLHENQTIHRDIAPSNVLLNKTIANKTVAKLGGFGYSIQLQGCYSSVVEEPFETRLNYSSHSSSYKAVECYGSHGVYSKQSDIFALGILMHYALTGGDYPFKSNTEIKQRENPAFDKLRKSEFDAKKKQKKQQSP